MNGILLSDIKKALPDIKYHKLYYKMYRLGLLPIDTKPDPKFPHINNPVFPENSIEVLKNYFAKDADNGKSSN